jgi:hypothetical protein
MTLILDNPSRVISAAAGAPTLTDYDTDLIAPSWDLWLPDTGYVTVDGGNKISAVATQKLTGGQTLAQGASAQQPLLVANQINGRAAMRFARAGAAAPTRFLLTDFPAGAALSWTKFAVMKSAYVGVSNTHSEVLGTNTTTGGHRLELVWASGPGDQIQARAGNALGSTAAASYPDNAWFFVAAAWDHVIGQSAISVDGATWVLAGTTGLSATLQTVGIGDRAGVSGSNQGLNADIAMIGVYPAALHLAGQAAPWADLKSFVRDTFALTIA